MKEKRRAITIDDKLKVVTFYLALKKEKETAAQKLEVPRPKNATRADLKKFFADRKKYKKKMRFNLQKECAQKFPDLVGHCMVYRWVQKAAVDSWGEMPQCARARLSEAPNDWRRKMGLRLKGRNEGGEIPLALQKELDMLMFEMSSGMSEVTQRRELVTVENVVSWFSTCWFCLAILGRGEIQLVVMLGLVVVVMAWHAHIHKCIYLNR